MEHKSPGYKFLLLPALTLMLFSCSVENRLARNVKKEFEGSEILRKYHAGFALYDPAHARTLFEHQSHKYFTPASNAKLLTFYGSLKMLPETVSALKYIEKGDSLIFWGTGDPSFLQSELKGTEAYRFLSETNKNLYYAPGRYTGDFYGAGWQWDDYNDYYQAEINELPVMDNLVKVKNAEGKLIISPPGFRDAFFIDSAETRTFKITRDFNTNSFKQTAARIPVNYTQAIPYKLSVQTTLSLLADTLRKPVGLIKMSIPPGARSLPGLKRDTILKYMMQPSDNFMAEQLLLLCSDQLGAELNTKKAIGAIQQQFLTALPDKAAWVDGSGLSRYNLVTPADIIVLLDLIYKEFKDPVQLYNMLPGGGKTGTLKNAYPKTEHPFVFGKTGTISNNHSQSGYILTRKGKTYIYSFLNNNFVIPTADVRKEMGRIVTFIHEKF